MIGPATSASCKTPPSARSSSPKRARSSSTCSPSDLGAPPPLPPPGANGAEPPILTEIEWRQRERENMHAALVKSGWRIHGEGGAAELLGLKPTTLISRMKKMGLKRPAPAEERT